MKIGQNRPRSSGWHVSGWVAIVLAPLVLPLALLASIFSKPAKRTPAEVAGFIRDFIEGTGSDWDWDDFTSVRLADPKLEEIRRHADMIALPVTPEGRRELEALLMRADALKSAWIDAGQPD